MPHTQLHMAGKFMPIKLKNNVPVYYVYLFRRARHLSDPPYAEVTSSPPAYSRSPQASLSVGVSPASTLAAHGSFCYGDKEQELRQKLENSLKKEKALSQRWV